MSDVLVTPASLFPGQADTGDTTKFGPAAWRAPRVFGGGLAGQLLVRDLASTTGASWSAGLASLPLGADIVLSRVNDGGGLGSSLLVTGGSLKLPAVPVGPFAGAGFGGFGYRQTGEGWADPAWVFRGNGYAFENATPAWLAILHNDGGGNDGYLGIGIRSTDTSAKALARLHIRSGDARFDADVASTNYALIGLVGGAQLDLRTAGSVPPNIYFRPGTHATNFWIVHAGTQCLLTNADNTVDIGLAGSNRPRNGYFSGTLSFGVRSALAGETVTGYLTVTDAGGTTRKLAVVS